MIIIGLTLGFCLILLLIMGVHIYLRGMTHAFVKKNSEYTNMFLMSGMSLDDYVSVKKELRNQLSPVLKWYMKKVGVEY